MENVQKKTRMINNDESIYVHAVFEALMTYQSIELLLKKCILRSYELESKKLQFKLNNLTPKQIDRIENKQGLGQLIREFEKITHHASLCENIKNAADRRNKIAHSAAANYLKFPVSKNGFEMCKQSAKDIEVSTDQALVLYYELCDVFNMIMLEHGKET